MSNPVTPEAPKVVETPAAVAPVAVTPVAPAAQAVDIEAIKEEGKKAERKRVADINALCVQAKKPEMAAQFIDSEIGVAEVQSKLFAALCEGQQPTANIPSDAPPSGIDKENAKFVAEYKGEPAYAKSMTQDEYIAMRRVDEGMEVLSAGSKK